LLLGGFGDDDEAFFSLGNTLTLLPLGRRSIEGYPVNAFDRISAVQIPVTPPPSTNEPGISASLLLPPRNSGFPKI